MQLSLHVLCMQKKLFWNKNFLHNTVCTHIEREEPGDNTIAVPLDATVFFIFFKIIFRHKILHKKKPRAKKMFEAFVF